MKKNNMKKIYLAIPYTGFAESAYEQSTKAAAMIMSEYHYNVFSPITMTHPLTLHGLKGKWEYWEQIDFQYIDWADELWVYVHEENTTFYKRILNSIGVIAEIAYARKANKPVLFFTFDYKGIEKIKIIQ